MTPPTHTALNFAPDLHNPASLEASLAARLARALSSSTASLPHDLSERLRLSRETALKVAKQSRRASALDVNQVSTSGAAVLRGGPAAWDGLSGWMSTLLPVLLLLAGLWAMGQITLREQILTSADIDTQLLADELPPAAYGDPGFVQYLRHGPLQ
jgi:Protein of unknown function (DUF3619)